MVLKGILKGFVLLSALAVAGLMAYHYSVEEKTPSTAAFQAFEEYNDAMTSVASIVASTLGKAVSGRP